MVESKPCSFCGKAIEPGTGKMYIKRDGTIYTLCTNKCKKNLIDLKRVPRRTRWTKRYAELKESKLKHETAVSDKKPDEPDIKKEDIEEEAPLDLEDKEEEGDVEEEVVEDEPEPEPEAEAEPSDTPEESPPEEEGQEESSSEVQAPDEKEIKTPKKKEPKAEK